MQVLSSALGHTARDASSDLVTIVPHDLLKGLLEVEAPPPGFEVALGHGRNGCVNLSARTFDDVKLAQRTAAS